MVASHAADHEDLIGGDCEAPVDVALDEDVEALAAEALDEGVEALAAAALDEAPPVGAHRHGCVWCPACPMQSKPAQAKTSASHGCPQRPLATCGVVAAAAIHGAGGGGGGT